MTGSGSSRLDRIQNDPRFKIPKKKQLKGKIDARFKDALLTDKEFQSKAKTDRYGKRVQTRSAVEKIGDLYDLESSSDEDSGEHKVIKGRSRQPKASKHASSSNEEESSTSESESDSEEETGATPSKPRLTKAQILERMRGEVSGGSSSSESESESESEGDNEVENDRSGSDKEIEKANELVRGQGDGVPVGEAHRRFAVVNLDWDNVRAVDLMVTLGSFVPKGHKIKSVKIFPSEYGKQQMAEEELNGPPRHLFDSIEEGAQGHRKKQSSDVNVVEDDEDADYNSSRLRRYQLQRLQYYYAVVECDSVECASAVYEACDGTEYESSANFFDLRYVPDEVQFEDKPKDECFSVPANYKPNDFITDALQHSKVRLTWDETPKERAQVALKAFSRSEIDDMDLKAYLASDSESESENRDRLRKLVGKTADDGPEGSDDDFGSAPLDQDSEDDSGMEITFNPVLDGKDATFEIIGKPAASVQAQDVNIENLSTIEKYRLKEKERRLRRMEKYKQRKAEEAEEAESAAKAGSSDKERAELELLLMDDESGKSVLSSDKSKAKRNETRSRQKRREKEEAEADFDTADPRFQALYENPDFAIDSTAPQYKKTKGMDVVVAERRARLQKSGQDPAKERSYKRARKDTQSKSESVDSLVKKFKSRAK